MSSDKKQDIVLNRDLEVIGGGLLTSAGDSNPENVNDTTTNQSEIKHVQSEHSTAQDSLVCDLDQILTDLIKPDSTKYVDHYKLFNNKEI